MKLTVMGCFGSVLVDAWQGCLVYRPLLRLQCHCLLGSLIVVRQHAVNTESMYR